MHLSELIDMTAGKNPDKDCVRIGGKGYSYKTIKELSDKAAGLFQDQGIKRGDKVAIMSQNTLGFILAFFGTQKAGATAVPINHKLMPPEVDYILEHSESKIFLFDGSLAEIAAKLSTKVKMICMDSPAEGFEQFEPLLDTASPFSPVEVSDEDIAEILYTSGTTGKPKGCLHTHRNVIMAGITMVIAIKFTENDRILIAMPIWHSSPLNNWFIGITYVGGTTVMIREYHPLHFLQAIQEEKCTAFFGAPIAFIMPVQMIPNFDEFDLSSVRVWMYGGGPIPADTALTLMKKYKNENFYQCYGMTETGPTGTVLFPRDQVRKAGSIGREGLPGCDVKVMKTDIEPAKPGDVGEIWLKADSMMKGYYKNSEATAEAFKEGWYKSGDVARVDEEGYMFIADRTKDMIVTGGENVYSKEVEDVIGTHPDVAEVAVIAIPHPEWGETVGAIVVPAKDKELTGDLLNSFIADKLAKFKIPKIYKFVDELPHTASGKVMKYKLREEYK
ncbi:MAG: long-chain-fatty-acid--CoA ligase [Deltaproteobacteria bacterium]|nr:long-chain-fatty-acid--CoA ligase [Deltaproteobacteria bacterium]